MRSRTLWACSLVAVLCATAVMAGTPAQDYVSASAQETAGVRSLSMDRGVISPGTMMIDAGRQPRMAGNGGVAGGGEPTLVYSNEGTLLLNDLAGVQVADDVETIAPVGTAMSAYGITVWGGGDPGTGDGFTVIVGLYDGCPRGGGSLITGTEYTETFDDDDQYDITVDLTGAGVVIPDDLWVAVEVSDADAGWLGGVASTIGFTDDLFDYPLFPCTTWFGGDPYAGFNARIWVTEAIPETFVAFESAASFAALYGGEDDACTALQGCGDGLELGTECEAIADDLQLIVQECELVRYEVKVGGFTDDLGNAQPFEVEFALYENVDGEGIPANDWIEGTECCYEGIGDGFIETAICEVPAGTIIPDIVWLGMIDSSIDAGYLISDVPAITGTAADCFNVFEDGLWSGCVYTFGGGEGCDGGACGSFNAKVICAGEIPTGACCDVWNEPYCTEGVQWQDCDGRWVENGTCDAETFDPPCGAGACCLPDGSCENLLEADCLAAEGFYQHGEFCYEGDQLCPSTACLTSEEPCDEGHDSPGCNDAECCDRVCTRDPFCCTNFWEDSPIPGTGCVYLAEELCGECDYDSCENAAVVTEFPQTFQGNNTYCTTDCNALRDLQDGEAWITFTLDQADDVKISYCDSGTLFNNAWLTLYDSCPCGEVAAEGAVSLCNDGNPEITFEQLPAGTYYYPIMSETGAAGSWNITVELIDIIRPFNDLCENADIADTLPHTFTGTNIDSTNDCDETADADGEVWLQFTLDECSDVQIDYCDSPTIFANAWLTLFDACPCGDIFAFAEVIADGCTDGNPAMLFSGLGAGIYYYPVMAEADAEGEYNITVTATPAADTPANDVCTNADHYDFASDGSHTYTGTNENSCNDCPEITDSDGEVWLSFSIPAAGDVTVDYCGTDPVFENAWVVLFDQCPCGGIFAFAEVDLEVCTDGNPGMHFYDLPAGTYYFPVMESVEDNASGDYNITVTYSENPPPPANDRCQDADYAVLAMDTPSVFTGTNLDSTLECTEHLDTVGDVWISFTIEEAADIEIAYCGSDAVFENAWLLLFDNCPCDDQYTVGGFEVCGDDNPIMLFPNMDPGTYFHPVMYDPGTGAASESYVLTVTATEPTVIPDDCEDAVSIALGDTEFTTLGAETDGPAHPGHESCDAYDDDQVNQDVWYAFQSPCEGTATISTCDSADFDTRVAIYEGTDCPVAADRLVGCNDDGDGCTGYTSILEVELGECEDYLLRIGGFDTESGTGTVNISMDCVPVTCGVDFESSVPAHDSTLWRGGMNYMTLEFTGTLSAAPMAGEIMIQELLDGGAYGDDLSGSFTFEADGSSLAITETTEVLEHRTWYAIRNAGTWDGVGDFEIHLLLQVGDANEDGFVLPNDLSLINTMVPTFEVGPESRMDINGDTRVLPNDLSRANVSIPSFSVTKPAGH